MKQLYFTLLITLFKIYFFNGWYQVLHLLSCTGVWGTPYWDTPHPDLAGGYPLLGGIPCPDLAGGYPLLGGIPRPDLARGYPIPATGIPPPGVPLSGPGQGTPLSGPGQGIPYLDLTGVPPVWTWPGYPPPAIWTWPGYLPVWTWPGYPPPGVD